MLLVNGAKIQLQSNGTLLTTYTHRIKKINDSDLNSNIKKQQQAIGLLHNDGILPFHHK